MHAPELDVGVCEEYESADDLPPTHPRYADLPSRLQHIWVGRKIADGQRHLINTYDVKKRVHIGNTSMEAEASLLMANFAHASPGRFIYDPFAGTGSMLLTSAHFGAYVVGSDIGAVLPVLSYKRWLIGKARWTPHARVPVLQQDGRVRCCKAVRYEEQLD